MSAREELFDIIDDEGQIIGQAPRKLCHGDPGLVHQAVHVLIFNTQEDLLLQKRSLDKDIQPGKWDTSVGGHLDLGESYRAAARREMIEELGLTGLPLTFLYKSKIRNEVESENIETFLTITDDDVMPDPAEVAEVRFWTYGEIEDSLGRGVFTPNFKEEWGMLKEFARKYQQGTSGLLGLCSGDSMPDLLTRLAKE